MTTIEANEYIENFLHQVKDAGIDVELISSAFYRWRVNVPKNKTGAFLKCIDRDKGIGCLAYPGQWWIWPKKMNGR
jgi:hypothetical protein